MENKAIEYLRELRKYVSNFNDGAIITNAVYITPAQQLRNSADEMEAKERLLREIDDFLQANKEI